MSEIDTRTRLILGDAAIEKLKASHVALFGLGGVGGYCLEALVRAGVGELDLYDGDVFDASNLSRQSNGQSISSFMLFSGKYGINFPNPYLRMHLAYMRFSFIETLVSFPRFS